jgi:DNA-binding transcriptional MerR regulator
MTTSDLSGRVKASEAARLLGIHPRTLAKWSDSGVLAEPVRIGPGRFRYYRISNIEALAHEHEVA